MLTRAILLPLLFHRCHHSHAGRKVRRTLHPRPAPAPAHVSSMPPVFPRCRLLHARFASCVLMGGSAVCNTVYPLLPCCHKGTYKLQPRLQSTWGQAVPGGQEPPAGETNTILLQHLSVTKASCRREDCLRTCENQENPPYRESAASDVADGGSALPPLRRVGRSSPSVSYWVW